MVNNTDTAHAYLRNARFFIGDLLSLTPVLLSLVELSTFYVVPGFFVASPDLGTACLRASDSATGGKNFDLRFGLDLGGGGNRQREYRNEAAHMPDAFIHVSG
jgi:hypothetical protein